MHRRPHRSLPLIALLAIAATVLAGPSAAIAKPTMQELVSPLFGLDAAPDGSLLIADGGSGVVSWRNDTTTLVTELPGVTDVSSIGRSSMFAVTGAFGGPLDQHLFRISNGRTTAVADLGEFEATVNPDGAQIDSNPFAVAALTGGRALVADAAANALLTVDGQGHVDWVATLPSELAGTAAIKALLGCPNPPPGLEFACGLPEFIPAEPVTTSVAVGPDGAYYVGELKGVPAPIGMSKVWRIEPGTRHAQCGSSPQCSVVADGFTSIVDLDFGPDGTLYVTEIDEASWAAVEFGSPSGGTVNACTWGPAPLSCSVVATNLVIPSAATVYAVIGSLVPGAATVVALD